MTINQLEYFCAVCRDQSVSRAAERLHISQPGISKALRELEAEIGIALFRKEGRGLTLTEQGKQFYAQAVGIVNHLDRFHDAVEGISAQETLTIGVPPMIGSLLLPKLYQQYAQTPHSYSLRIVEDGRASLIEALDQYRIDMAFLPHDTKMDAYRSCRIGCTETVCCMSKRHRLHDLTAIPFEALQEEALVLFSDSFFQTARVLEEFQNCGITPRILMQSSQLSTIVQMITQDLAVGFLFKTLIDSMEDVCAIPLSPPMPVEVSLVWKQEMAMTESKRSFVALASGLSL